MAFNFKMTNVNMVSSHFANGLNVSGNDANIEINGGTYVNVDMLNNADVSNACQFIEKKISQMTPEEYASYQFLVQSQKDSEKRRKGLQAHLISFAEGVAASVIATLLTR